MSQQSPPMLRDTEKHDVNTGLENNMVLCRNFLKQISYQDTVRFCCHGKHRYIFPPLDLLYIQYLQGMGFLHMHYSPQGISCKMKYIISLLLAVIVFCEKGHLWTEADSNPNDTPQYQKTRKWITVMRHDRQIVCTMADAHSYLNSTDKIWKIMLWFKVYSYCHTSEKNPTST